MNPKNGMTGEHASSDAPEARRGRGPEAWLEIRRLKIRSIAATIALLVIPLLLLRQAAPGEGAQKTAEAALICAAVLAVAALYFTVRMALWKCPRCGKAFHDPFRGQLRHPWISSSCAWCGQKLGEPLD